ncbi:PREDICTED: histidine kinase CKI1-like [Erythranthe guttata]|uniref:histidine kinase CKI1-like n=1 Tax=Erythranthe guttata TaxID=4155 RepID=UPI00064D7EB9|nr:PREDICTED: histidine kinase CKI1-like [Erythranthe guttata]|eukprot:XP_012836535.1 PREDICTED: histidine kinase CKI1-like [Erythranthe guttata]
MHRIGIKVHIVKQYEQLSPSLKRIKRKLNLSHYSSSGKSTTSSARSKKEFPLSALEGTDDVLPNPRAGYSGFVLIVIDTSVGLKKKPLLGRKVLVADDDPIGRTIATFVGVQLGASIFPCENGEEAWKLFCKSLDEGNHVGASKTLLDCILMDCEMSVMNGVEETARIRKAEESYGVRILIIALTAHKKGQEIDNIFCFIT